MSYDILREIAQSATLDRHVREAQAKYATTDHKQRDIQGVLERHFPVDVQRTQTGLAVTLRSSRSKHPPYLTVKLDEPMGDPHATYARRIGPALIQVYEGGEDGLEGTGQGAAHGRQQEDQVVLS